MVLETELKDEVEVPLYSSRNAQLTGDKKVGQMVLGPGQRKVIYLSDPKSLPKFAKPGDILKGAMQSHKLKDGKIMMGDFRGIMMGDFRGIVGNPDEVPSGLNG